MTRNQTHHHANDRTNHRLFLTAWLEIPRHAEGKLWALIIITEFAKRGTTNNAIQPGRNCACRCAGNKTKINTKITRETDTRGVRKEIDEFHTTFHNAGKGILS